jgi:hypothetical protein
MTDNYTDLREQLGRIIARNNKKFAWSEMTKGEKNEEVHFVQQQLFKELEVFVLQREAVAQTNGVAWVIGQWVI